MTGRNISSERSRLGLTQSELAKRLGVATSSVSYWETDSFEPTSDSLKN